MRQTRVNDRFLAFLRNCSYASAIDRAEPNPLSQSKPFLFNAPDELRGSCEVNLPGHRSSSLALSAGQVLSFWAPVCIPASALF